MQVPINTSKVRHFEAHKQSSQYVQLKETTTFSLREVQSEQTQFDSLSSCEFSNFNNPDRNNFSIYKLQLSEFRSSLNSCKQKFLSRIACTPYPIHDILVGLMLVIKYGDNLMIFYQLMFGDLPSMIENNSERIQKVKLTKLMLALLINFEIENLLQQFIHNINDYAKSSTFLPMNLQRRNDSLQRRVQGQEPLNNTLLIKPNSYNVNYFLLVVGISVFAFQLLRLEYIEKIFNYVKIIHDNQINKRWDHQKIFVTYGQLIVQTTLIGYVVMKVLAKYLNATNNDDGDSSINENRILLSESSRQEIQMASISVTDEQIDAYDARKVVEQNKNHNKENKRRTEQNKAHRTIQSKANRQDDQLEDRIKNTREFQFTD